MFVQITEPESSSLQSPPKSKAIGIDLGTTHTVVAYIKEGQPTTVRFKNSNLLPSTVTYSATGEISIGEELSPNFKNQTQQFSSFKRQMDHPAVQLVGGKTPVELSGLVLKHAKEEAEKILSEPIDQAVITVPAYFDETARQATKDAAQLAGLEVLRLINEPTAAALAYGLDQGVEGIYAIYDLGGGTFDISLLKMTKGVFQVLATSGDIHLGGDDIDQAIVNHWQKDIGNIESISFKLARKAKEALFEKDDWEEKRVRLNRTELSILATPFIQKTLAICEKALKDASLNFTDIKGVVLVGGSTRLKDVRLAVKDLFQQEPLTNVDPDQIVAFGAAIQAHALTRGGDSLLLDVTPLSLGLETMGGIVEKIIPRNTPIPATVTQEFTTYQAGQTAIKFHIVQGERELVKDCRSLAEFTLTNIPSLPAGLARIEVTFNLDSDGLLTVKAEEKTTNIAQDIIVKPSYGLNSDDFEKMLRDSFQNAKQDIQKRLLISAQIKAKQMIEYLQTALNDDMNLLSIKEKNEFEKDITVLKKVLNQESLADIQTQIQNVSTLMQPFLERRMTKVLNDRLTTDSKL